MEVATKLAKIGTMSFRDRILLVQAIWDSIEADAVPTKPTDVQKTAFGQRMKELDENPKNVLSWEQIEDYVRI